MCAGLRSSLPVWQIVLLIIVLQQRGKEGKDGFAGRSKDIVVEAASGSLQSILDCFDFHFDRFEGLMFHTENPLENVCATEASPEA